MNKEKKITILLILNIIKLSMLKKNFMFLIQINVSYFVVNLYRPSSIIIF